MKHIYHINGMSCNGCRGHVEKTLNQIEGVTNASVDLEKAEATIEMENHIPLEALQAAMKKDGGSYSIHNLEDKSEITATAKKSKAAKKSKTGNETGTYYCPMHCEGDKTYDKPGDCPVCGMDLVAEQSLTTSNSERILSIKSSADS